jgi:hypothetical protein
MLWIDVWFLRGALSAKIRPILRNPRSKLLRAVSPGAVSRTWVLPLDSQHPLGDWLQPSRALYYAINALAPR